MRRAFQRIALEGIPEEEAPPAAGGPGGGGGAGGTWNDWDFAVAFEVSHDSAAENAAAAAYNAAMGAPAAAAPAPARRLTHAADVYAAVPEGAIVNAEGPGGFNQWQGLVAGVPRGVSPIQREGPEPEGPRGRIAQLEAMPAVGRMSRSALVPVEHPAAALEARAGAPDARPADLAAYSMYIVLDDAAAATDALMNTLEFHDLSEQGVERSKEQFRNLIHFYQRNDKDSYNIVWPVVQEQYGALMAATPETAGPIMADISERLADQLEALEQTRIANGLPEFELTFEGNPHGHGKPRHTFAAIKKMMKDAGLKGVLMPKKQYVKEHKRIIGLLNKAGKEGKEQAAELSKEMKGGRGQASGFVMRMMAEAKLKHEGKPYGKNPRIPSYKNPTDPMSARSTMNQPVAFDFKKLANSKQSGRNSSAYGASPFIIRHFGGPTINEEGPYEETAEQTRARNAWRKQPKRRNRVDAIIDAALDEAQAVVPKPQPKPEPSAEEKGAEKIKKAFKKGVVREAVRKVVRGRLPKKVGRIGLPKSYDVDYDLNEVYFKYKKIAESLLRNPDNIVAGYELYRPQTIGELNKVGFSIPKDATFAEIANAVGRLVVAKAKAEGKSEKYFDYKVLPNPKMSKEAAYNYEEAQKAVAYNEKEQKAYEVMLKRPQSERQKQTIERELNKIKERLAMRKDQLAELKARFDV